jgi:hypothetical protein
MLTGTAATSSVVLGRLIMLRGLGAAVAGWSAAVGVLLSAVRTAVSRTFFVRLQDRTLTVDYEDRSMNVGPETRTITPENDGRTVFVREETRQIDA